MEIANGKSEWKRRMERATGKNAVSNRRFQSPFPIAVSRHGSDHHNRSIGFHCRKPPCGHSLRLTARRRGIVTSIRELVTRLLDRLRRDRLDGELRGEVQFHL